MARAGSGATGGRRAHQEDLRGQEGALAQGHEGPLALAGLVFPRVGDRVRLASGRPCAAAECGRRAADGDGDGGKSLRRTRSRCAWS